jgi:hypothetical protein
MFSDRSVFGDERSSSLPVGVLIHTQGAGRRLNKRYKVGTVLRGTRQKELQSLFKMKTRIARGHD